MSNIHPSSSTHPFQGLFCVRSSLFIAYNTFKQQKQTQSALEADAFTFQLYKEPSYKIHEKLKETKVFCCVNELLWKVKKYQSQLLKSLCDSAYKSRNTDSLHKLLFL